jgi:hypothetical protein
LLVVEELVIMETYSSLAEAMPTVHLQVAEEQVALADHRLLLI